MKLSEKQIERIAMFAASVNLANGLANAVEDAAREPTLANLKKARKAMVAELKKLDKALAEFGLSVALDEARALIAKAEAPKA
jgi:hypothetical protein